MFCAGAFYFLLGNLSPHLRSKISRIQLLCLVKEIRISKLTLHYNCVLFFNYYFDIKDEGVPFIIDGRTCHFRGTVSIVSADNPASAALGGFKESASAFRFCRHCLGTDTDIQTKVNTSALFMCLK